MVSIGSDCCYRPGTSSHSAFLMEHDPIIVREYGPADGPDVLVLHGGPGAPGAVAAVARVLGERGFHSLEPLQRRAGGGSPLTVSRHIADLAAVAPEQVLVVGHSWGAMLALSYASVHPIRVRAIVLVGCGTYDEASRAAYQQRMQENLGPEGRARIAELQAQLETRRPDAEREAVFAALGQRMTRAQAYDPVSETQDSASLPVDPVGHGETWADAVRLQAEGIEPARFASIRCPVLLLQGDTDPHPGPTIADSLRPYLPQLEYEELPRCGHEPWRERHARDAFYTTLSRWLWENTGLGVES